MDEQIKLDDFNLFFRRYEKFLNYRKQLRLTEFKNSFGHIKAGLKIIISVLSELNKATALNFNIFRLLGVDREEVRTHSAFLADLLNPMGTHGQKAIFLESFLRYCREKFNGFPIPRDDINKPWWFVEREMSTLSFGRLDLVIKCPEFGFMVVIENKIGAGDQEDQLKRYSQWLSTQKKYFPNQALIYLTPTGSKSPTGDDKEYNLSYHDDIKVWLEDNIKDIKAQRLREIINQYIEIINNI